MTRVTGLGRLVGGKGEGFIFINKIKRREVEVAGCCCLSIVSAGVPRGMISLGTATVPHSPK